jgi:hypothetical protein
MFLVRRLQGKKVWMGKLKPVPERVLADVNI